MVSFLAVIQPQQNSIGWVHILLPNHVVLQLQIQHKKSFSVKGFIDDLPIKQLALLPAGNGDYYLPLNATIRKKLNKSYGNTVQLLLAVDTEKYTIPAYITESIMYEPTAHLFFETLPTGHKNYFAKWIDAATHIDTKTKRLQMTIEALLQQQGFGQMIRNNKKG